MFGFTTSALPRAFNNDSSSGCLRAIRKTSVLLVRESGLMSRGNLRLLLGPEAMQRPLGDGRRRRVMAPFT